MKHKLILKKYGRMAIVFVIVFQVIFAFVGWKEQQAITKNYDYAIASILKTVQEKYPKIHEAELIEILNQEEFDEEYLQTLATDYGIDLKKESLLQKNEKQFWSHVVLDGCMVGLLVAGLISLFLKYNSQKEKELQQITYYIEQINQRNYQLEIDSNSEDELSILKNEIYKTTVMLKEAAENAKKGKKALKDSLSDISHQIKTPLTSILIMLENMEEHPEMELSVQQFYLKNMKREIQNINFLVQSLLKLSKLETDTVVFSKETVDVKELVNAAIQKVDMLCDLKNVDIKLTGDSGTIFCDFRWQVEAITNVLKNCVEYSPENEVVMIDIQDNPMYVSIVIRDFGPGMDEEDQKHIFERFYKGKKSVSGSIGIGLALAKATIESNHGKINVESSEERTKFVIKYYK